MSEENRKIDIAKKTVVSEIPGVDSVMIRRDLEYQATDARVLTMDLYCPPDSKPEERLPAVIIVAGYPDWGVEKKIDCKFKETGWSVSWGRLMAASGLRAITYTNREPEPDLHALLLHVRRNAARLGIDENRIGLWAGSGNVPLALSVLIGEGRDYLKCAVLCYGYMLDLDGFTHMAEASKTWGFVNPCAGKSVDDLPQDLPLFIARAGQDQFPHLNESLDRFLVKSVARNLPITFVNHHTAPHAFDLFHDSEVSREIIKQILAFLRLHLSA